MIWKWNKRNGTYKARAGNFHLTACRVNMRSMMWSVRWKDKVLIVSKCKHMEQAKERAENFMTKEVFAAAGGLSNEVSRIDTTVQK